MYRVGYQLRRCQHKIWRFRNVSKTSNYRANVCVRRSKELDQLYSHPNYHKNKKSYNCIISLQHYLLVAAFNLLQDGEQIPYNNPFNNAQDRGYSVGGSVYAMRHILTELEETDQTLRLKDMVEHLGNNYFESEYQNRRISNLQSELFDVLMKCIETKHKHVNHCNIV